MLVLLLLTLFLELLDRDSLSCLTQIMFSPFSRELRQKSCTQGKAYTNLARYGRYVQEAKHFDKINMQKAHDVLLMHHNTHYSYRENAYWEVLTSVWMGFQQPCSSYQAHSTCSCQAVFPSMTRYRCMVQSCQIIN